MKKAPRKTAGRARPVKPARIRLAVDDRRAQLVALGLAAFSVRPYHAVSVEAIAGEAGISRGLLFHYFPTKRDFYLACLELMAGQMLEASFREAPESVPPEELLQMMARGLDSYFAFIEVHADAFFALLNAGAVEGAEDVVTRTRREFVTRLRAYLPPEIPGVDERAIRAGLRGWVGLVEGIALDWAEHRDLSRAERVQLALGWAMALPGSPMSVIAAR